MNDCAMLNPIFKSFLLLNLALCISTAARADIFEYSKNTYGVDAPACQKEATALAEKLASLTSGTTKAAYCASMTGGGFDIRVLTEAGSVPNLELALFGFRVIIYDYPGQKGPINKRYSVLSDEGTYRYLPDCLKALPQYETSFQLQTGLTPISAQCARQGEYQYVVQVDAFGKGTRHLYELSVDLSRGSSSEASLLDVTNYLHTVGAAPMTVARPGSYILVRYFSDSEIKLASFQLDKKNVFIQEKECLDALTFVQPILFKSGETRLVSLRCGKGFGQNFKEASSMSAIFDVTSSNGKIPKFEVLTYGQFPTYGECRSQISTTPNSYCAADVDSTGAFHGYSLNVISMP